ncbi:AzlC family ABC transporter permease [Beduinella massiliensis]|uniref:AzlC family ABC transporter permease n=1 Tax=Beduinella massiliensis TaxID=1852363 RepID=UPI000C82C9B4
MRKEDFARGLRHGVPIALGYLSVSFAFGIQAVGGGLTPFQAVFISMTNLTSAGQFAGLSLMLSAAPLFEMALTQLIINLRYALMSLSLSQRLDGSMTTLWRVLISFGNTDEIFAVASSQPGKVGRDYLLGLVCLPYFGWAGGTLLGAAAGALLPSLITQALGIAIYGMFLAIILPPARAHKNVRLVVLASTGVSCILRYVPALSFISSGFAIILCAVLAAALGAILFPIREAE